MTTITTTLPTDRRPAAIVVTPPTAGSTCLRCDETDLPVVALADAGSTGRYCTDCAEEVGRPGWADLVTVLDDLHAVLATAEMITSSTAEAAALRTIAALAVDKLIDSEP